MDNIIKFDYKKLIILPVLLIFLANNVNAQCDPLTADDTEVCESTILRATDPALGTGVWTTTGGANIVSESNHNTEVNNLDFGSNTFIWSVAAINCEESIDIEGIKMAVDAGPDQPNACASTNLNGSNPNPGTGYWTSSNPTVIFDDSTSPTALVSNLPAGDTQFTWNVEYKTCLSTDVMTVTNNTPQNVNAGADDEACIGDSIQLNGSVPPANASGSWSVMGGNGTFTNPSLYNTWVSNLDPDNINVLRWTVTNAYCSEYDDVNITNNSINIVDFTDPGPYCTDVGQLSVSDLPAGATGQWQIVASTGNIVNDNSNFTSVTNLNFDANTFKWVAQNGGCTEELETTIFAYPVEATANSSVAEACTDNVTLYGNDPSAWGGSGVWSVDAGNGSFADVTSPTTTVTGMNSYVTNSFTWTVNVNGCTDDATVSVDYNEASPAVITTANPVTSCDGNATITAQPTDPNDPDEYGYWTSTTPGVNIATPSNPTTNVSNLQEGANLFTWHVSNGTCPESTAQITVNYYNLATVDAGPDDDICTGDYTLTADPLSAGQSGQWTFTSGGVGSTIIDPTNNTSQVIDLQRGINTLQWEVTQGSCTQTDLVSITNYSVNANITTPSPHYACTDPSGLITANNPNTQDIANPATAASGSWSVLSGGSNVDNSLNHQTTFSNLDEGSNKYIWTITNGFCTDKDTIEVIYNVPSGVDAGADDDICTDEYFLSATPLQPGESGFWTFTTGGVGSTIVDPTNNETQVYDLQRGINTLQWAVTKGTCTATDLITITNYSVNANISTGSPQVTCTDPSQMVTANNPSSQDIANPATAASGSWSVLSGGSTVDNPNNYQTTFSNLDEGSNKYIWTITNGTCSDTDIIEVINNIPTQADAGRDTILCSTTLPNLNGNDYDPLRETGFWRRISGGATITNTSLANSSVTNLDYYCTPDVPDWWNNVNAVNTFEWVIQRESNGVTCESTDQVTVANGLPENIDAGVDQTVCDNVVNLDALDEGSCSEFQWWEQLPDVGDFEDPFTGATIPDAYRNMPFNVHVDSIQDGMSQFVWHLRNEYTTIDGIPVNCELTDTVEITSLGLAEDVNAGQNKALCSENWTMNATDPNSVWPSSGYSASGSWSIVHGNGTFADPTYNNTEVTDLAYDTNIFRWTVTTDTGSDVCVMTDDVYIHNGLPSAAQVGPDRDVCDTYTVISANNPARSDAQWWEVLDGGGTITGSSCADFYCTAQIDNMSSEENTFVWHVREDYTGPIAPYTAGNPLECELTDTITITNNRVTASAGADIYMCADTAQLLATPPAKGSGYWSTSTGTFASTGGATSTVYNDVIRGLTTGQNTLTWTVTNGSCSDSDNVVVWNNLPPTPYANNDQTVCNSSAQLSASPSNLPLNQPSINSYYYGEWTAMGTATIETPTAYNTRVHDIPEQSGTYFIWHTYNDFDDGNHAETCELTDIMYIFNNSVTAEAGSDLLTQCGDWGVGADFQLNANPSYNGVWSGSPAPGATITNPTLHNTTVTGATDGDHVYRWTVSYTTDGVTCSDDDFVNVPVRIPTTSNVNPNTAEICIDEVDLQANDPFSGVGTWTEVTTGGATILDPTANVTQAVNVSRNGNSIFRWTIDRDGCTSIDELKVTNNTILADADDRIDEDAILGSVSYNDSAICGNEYILSATDPNNFNSGSGPYPSGEWTVSPGTVTFDNPTLYNTTVRNLNALGDNTSELTWTITKGSCVESSRLDIINNEFTIDADVSSVTNEMETCDGTITLAGEQPGSGTGYWDIPSGGGNIQNPTLYNTDVTNVSKPSSVFRWTVTRNGCTTFDDVTVYNNSVTANAGVGFDVCGNTATLPGTPPAAGETGTWTPVLGGSTVTNETLYNSGVTNLAQGQNRFRWRITKGNCTADDYVEIINNEPNNFLVETDKESCSASNTISVNPAPDYSSGEYGEWSILAGGALTAITDITAINTTVTDLQPKFNEFQWTVTKGTCDKIGSIVITNNQVIADAGAQQSVCDNTAQLQAANPETNYTQQGTGTWTVITGGASVTDNTAYNSWVTDLDQGQNTFRWTLNEGGCSDDDDVSIFNNSVIASASNQVVCSNTATFDGNMPASADWGEWTVVGSSGTPNITTPSLNTSTVANLGSDINTFRWKVWNAQGCADSLDITINNQEFTTSAGPDNTICSDTYTLEGFNHGPGYSGQWIVVAGGATVSNTAQHNSVATGLTPGDNIFRWVVTSDAFGCVATDEVTIRNNRPTAASIVSPIPANRELCTNSVDVEAVQPVYGSGEWSSNNINITFTSLSNYQSTAQNLDPGSNDIIWTVENGACVDQTQITVINNEVTAVAGSNQVICSDNTYLNATDPSVIYPNQGTGYWTNLTANSAVIVNSLSPGTQVTNLPIGTTTFQWTVEKGICSESSTVSINNNSVEAVASSQADCGDTFTLNGNDPSTYGGTGYWEIIAGDGVLTNSAQYNTEITGVPKGSTSTLVWTVDNGFCTDSKQISVTNNNFNVLAGGDEAICGSTWQANATAPGTGTGYWTLLSGSGTFDNSASNTATVSGIGQGSSIFRWTITRNGCTNYDDINITNNSPGEALITGPPDTETCDGKVTLTASDPTPYADSHHWGLVAGNANFVTSTANLSVDVEDLSPGNNVFKWVVARGACPVNEDQITITNNQVVAVAGNDQVLCDDNTFLNATKPNDIYPYQGIGHWENISANSAIIVNSLLNTSEVTNLPGSTTSLRWVVELGSCTDDDVVVLNNRSVEAIATDIVGCSDTYTLNANDPSGFGGTGYWERVSGDAVIVDPSTQYDTEVTNVTAGTTSTLRWTVDNGVCQDSKEITVANNNFNVSAGSDQTICESTWQANATAPGTGTGYWTLLSGSGIFDNSASNTATVSGIGQGSSIFRWTITRNGCTNHDDINITNNSPGEALITGPPDTETCDGKVTLTASDPAPHADSHHWELVAGNANFVTPTANLSVDVEDLSPGNNVFKWIVARGTCPVNKDQITITNNQVVAVAGNDQVLCDDNTFLNATKPNDIYPYQGTGHWENISANSAIIVNSLLNTSQVTNLPGSTTSLRWVVELGSCTDDDVVVLDNRSVEAIATDIVGCSDTYTLNANDPSGFGGTGYWERVSGDAVIVDPSTQYDTEVTNVTAGTTSTLRWTVNNGICDDSKQITVANNSFSVNAGTNKTICESTWQANADDPGTGTGQWTVLSGSATFDNNTLNTSFVSGIGQGANTYRWTITKNSCSAHDDIVITNNAPSEALITGPVNTETCTGAITLTANNPSPYYYDTHGWELVSGGASFTSATNDFVVTVNNLAPGTNQFRWFVDRAGCDPNEDFITIVNNEVNAVAGNDQSLCVDNTNLSATATSDIYPFQGTGYWTNASANSAVIVNSLLNTSAVTNLPNGNTTFVWTVEKGGCVDTDNVVITNGSARAIAYDVAECDGDITLNGNDPSSFGGTGYWTKISGDGVIDNSVIYNTQILGVPNGATTTLSWTVNHGSCSDSETITATNNGFNIDAGVGGQTCDGTFELNAEPAGAGNSGYWELLSGSGIFANSTSAVTDVTAIGRGTNTFRWTVTRNGCTDYDDVVVSNNSPSVANITGPLNTETCDGTATLTAYKPSPLYADNRYWALVSGNETFLDPSTSYTMNVEDLAAGENQFKWVIERGSCPASEDFITIVNNQVDPYAGPDFVVCDTDADLSADPLNSGESGVWTYLSGLGSVQILSPSTADTEVTNLEPNTNTFRWTISKGNCSDFDDVTVSNKTVYASASDQDVCITTATLDGNNPGGQVDGSDGNPSTGYWQVLSGTAMVTNTALYNSGVTNITATNNLRWTVENSDCSSDIEIQIINNGFTIDAGTDRTGINALCSDSHTLNAQTLPSGSGVWTVRNGNGNFADASNNQTLVTDLSREFDNIFRWTYTQNNCTAYDEITIVNSLPVDPNAGVDQIVCTDNTTLNANSPQYGGTGYWTADNGTAIITASNSPNTDVSKLPIDNTTFTWTIERGNCSLSDDVVIDNNTLTAKAGPDKPVCDNYTNLEAKDPSTEAPNIGTGVWTADVGNTSTIVNSLLNTTQVTNLMSGDNKFFWTVSYGDCEDTDEVIITNNSHTPTASDQTVCGSSIGLDGNDPNPGSGFWTALGGSSATFDNSNNNTATVENLDYGSNQLKWTVDKNGCESSVTITVTNTAFDLSAGADQEVCTTTATLDGDDPGTGTGTWSVLVGTGVVTNPNDPKSGVTNLSTGTNRFKWSVTKNGCTQTAETVITNNTITADAGSDQLDLCANSATLAGNNVGDGGEWLLTGGTGTVAVTSQFDSQVTNLGLGENTFQWTVTKGICSDSDEVILRNMTVTAEAGTDQTICVDDYTLDADNPAGTGTGQWTITGGSGNVTDNTLYNTTVTNLGQTTNTLRWRVTNGVCTAEDFVNITNDRPDPAIANDLTICGTTAVMEADPVTEGSGLWNREYGTGDIAASDLSLYNAQVTNIDPGESQFKWTVTKGSCTDDVIISITSNLVTASATASPSNTVCEPTVTLQGNNPASQGATGLWTTGSSAVIESPSNYTTNVTNLGLGNTNFTWTVSKGDCDATANVSVTNNQVFADAGDDITTCNTAVTLNANDPGTGTGYWTDEANTGVIFTNSLQHNTQVSNLSYTSTNRLSWTVSENGCTDYDEIIITSNHVVADAGADQSDCSSTANLNAANQGGSGVWSVIGGSGTIADISSRTSAVSGLGLGDNTFRWTLTKNGCTGTDDVIITNNNPSDPDAGGDQEICTDNTSLTAINPTRGTGVWKRTNGTANFSSQSNYTTNVSGLSPGTNIFRWTLSHNGCSLYDELIVVNNSFEINAGPDDELCADTYTFNADPPGSGGSGLWTITSGSAAVSIDNPTLYNATASNLDQGINTFRWTVDRNGCTDWDEISITNNSPSVAVITSPAPNSKVCSDATTLQANIPTVGSGVWSEVSGITFGTRSNYQTTVSGMTPGSNTFTWTITNEGCTSQAQITIINDMVVADAGTGKDVCKTTTNLAAQSPGDFGPKQGTGYWTTGESGVIIANSLSNTSQVSNLGSGSNMFTWTVVLGSCSASDQVEINNAELEAVAYDMETCYGDVTSLNAAPPSTGQSGYWNHYTPSVTYSPTNSLYDAQVSGLVTGNNTFVWNLTNGICSDSISVIVESIKPVANAGSEQNLCESYTYLSANEPTSGQGVWSIVTGDGDFADPSLSGTYVSEIGQGNNVYQWTVTDRGCTDFDDVDVNNNLPIVSAGPDQSRCVDNVVLAGNEPAAGETGLWTQQNGIAAVITDETLYNTTVTGLGNGVSTFKWTVTNSDCTNSDMVAVTYNKLTPDAGDDQSTCNGVTNLIAADPSPAVGEWESLGAGTFDDPSAYATTVRGLADGPNTLRWTVKYRGCEEYDEIVIDNNEVSVTAGVDQYICENYATLSGNKPAAGATGVWSKSGGSGLIDDPTNNITDVTGLSAGSNVFTWTVTEAGCIKSDDVVIYNRQITNINAGVDRNVCDTETQLAALAPPAGTTGLWDVAAGGGDFADETLYNTAVSDLSGENQLRWTLDNGHCTASDIVTINNQMPTAASVSSDEEICTSTYTLVANEPKAGESGLWTKEFGAEGNILTPTEYVSTVTNVGAGTNTFRWTISNQYCDSYDDIIVTNNTISTDAGIDATICVDTAVLSGDNPAPGTGLWSLVNSGGSPSIDNPSQYSTVVRNLGSGSNTFKWTVTNGKCEAWDVVSIVNNKPTTANAGDDQIVCDGTVVLSGNNPTVGTGLWTRRGGSGDIQAPSNYNTLVTNLGSGGNTFRWTIEQGSCISYDDVTITNDLVYASAGMDDEICTDSYPELNGNMPAADESGEWTVSGGTGVFADPTLHNTAVSGLSQGENRFTWTVRRGNCQTASDVIITNNTPSTATVSSDQDICRNYATISGNPPTTGSGTWSLVAGNGDFDNASNNNTVVRDISPGVNQYQWTIQKGICSSSAVITITNNSVSAEVGDSIKVCGTQAYLNGNEPNADETGTWATIAGTGNVTNPTLYNSEVTGLNKGDNKFRWTVSNGQCNDYADIVVTNNLYDANASVAGPTTICSDEADLLGNLPVSGATGTWSVEAGAGTFDDPNNPSTVVRGLLKGDNTIRWSINKDGCINYDDVVITNNMVEAYAGDDIITCDNPVNLVANNLYEGYTGEWTVISGDGDIQDPSENQTMVTNLGAGTNVFQWTVSGNGCTAYDQVVVSENSFTTSAGLDKTICSPGTTLNGADPSPGTGIWSISGSPGVTFADPTSNVTTVSGLQDNSKNTFRWTVSKNGCTAFDEVVISNNLIKARAGGDQSVCQPEAIMSAQNPSPGTGYWTITSGGGTVSDPTNNTSEVEGLALGNNTLVWTVEHNSCTSQDVVIIDNNMVTATAGSDQVICSSETYLSGDQPEDGGYGIWEVVGGPCKVQTPSMFNSYVTNLQQGLNTLRWTVYENGCNNDGDLVTITNNSFNAYAGEDQLLPPLVDATSFGAQLPTGATGSWSILSGSANIADPLAPDSDVTNMTTGENTFRWTVQHNGCEDYDDVIITVRNFEPYAGDDQNVCGDSAKLNARDEGSNQQYWSKIYGAGDFDDPTDPKTWVKNLAPGENIYRWTVTLNGYTDYDEVTVTNNYFEISAGDNAESCYNEHTMNAEMPGAGGEGFWTVVGATSGGVFENNTLWNSRVSDLNPGKNRFRWEVQWRGCTDADTVEITWNRPPVAEFQANPSAFCAPEEVTFTNTSYHYPEQTPADTFFWYTANDLFAGTSTPDETVSREFDNITPYDSTHVIRLVALNTETGCIDTFSSSIDVYARPDIGFEARPIISYYPDATVNILNYPSAQPIQNYLWFFGNDQVGETILQEEFVNNFSYEFPTWGDYEISLTGTTPNGCEYTVSDSVYIMPPCPQSNADNTNAKGCEDLTVNFVAGVAYGESYHWKFGDGEESTEENPSHTYTEPGTYYVRLHSSGYGCDDVLIRIDTIQVYPEPVAEFKVEPREIMVPNQAVHFYNFSENGDRYEWDFGDTVSFDKEPIHYYSEPGVYDVSLQVWTENDCYASKTIERAVYATQPGMIVFPDAFTPDPSGSSGGAYPCGENFRDQTKDNDIFHPVYNGVTDYKLEIYNRWGEKIFESNDVCVGWDGYIDGVLAPQDVYVFKATGRYKNGGVFKETGSVTLLR